jgi:RNA polymerase sigma-70 factor (ECF subfamily)
VTQKSGTNGRNDPAGHSEDLELVREILRGQGEAEERFVKRMRCVPLILESRNSRLGSPLDEEDLRDLVQETLAAVWRKLDTYAGRSSLETWVYSYCINQLMNAIRSKQRGPRLAGDDAEDMAADLRRASDASFDEFEVIDGCLERLDGFPAEIIRLKFFAELTFNQIGARLGIPENSAKTHYYRGMNRLRTLVQPLLREDW